MYSLLNNKKVNLDGLTGPVQFSENGMRRNIELDVLNLRNNSFTKVRIVVAFEVTCSVLYLKNDKYMFKVVTYFGMTSLSLILKCIVAYSFAFTANPV